MSRVKIKKRRPAWLCRHKPDGYDGQYLLFFDKPKAIRKGKTIKYEPSTSKKPFYSKANYFVEIYHNLKIKPGQIIQVVWRETKNGIALERI